MSIYDELAGAAAVTMTEGAVKKITRKADSTVIWEKPVTEAEVYFVDEGNLGNTKVIILGQTYTEDGFVKVPLGTEATLYAEGGKIHQYGLGAITYEDETTNKTLAVTETYTSSVQIQYAINEDIVFVQRQRSGAPEIRIRPKKYYEEVYGQLPDYS